MTAGRKPPQGRGPIYDEDHEMSYVCGPVGALHKGEMVLPNSVADTLKAATVQLPEWRRELTKARVGLLKAEVQLGNDIDRVAACNAGMRFGYTEKLADAPAPAPRTTAARINVSALAAERDALRAVLEKLVDHGSWYYSAIELDGLEADGDELYEQAMRALGRPFKARYPYVHKLPKAMSDDQIRDGLRAIGKTAVARSRINGGLA